MESNPVIRGSKAVLDYTISKAGLTQLVRLSKAWLTKLIRLSLFKLTPFFNN